MPLRENLFLDRMDATSARPDLRGAQWSLFDRAEFLEPADRLLLELAIKKQLTCRQLSQLMSVPAGTVCRRLRRVINRLRDPMIVAILHPACPLPPEYRQLAIEHMLQRKSVRTLSEMHRMATSQIRQMLEHVR